MSPSSSQKKDKEFVTLWGILLREAQSSSKAGCMFSLQQETSNGKFRILAFARRRLAFPCGLPCNTIPHNVALHGGRG
jgi:hypothetical protein